MAETQQEKKGLSAAIGRTGKAVKAIGGVMVALSELLDTCFKARQALREIRKPTSPNLKATNTAKDE